MKKIFLCLICSGIMLTFHGQDPTIQEIQKQTERINNAGKDSTFWKKGGVVSINIGQGGSNNWAAGAEKFSFSTAAYLNLFANRSWSKYNWNNMLDLGYAFINTSSLGSRKTDDKIDFFSKLGMDITKTISAAGVVNFRSQFYSGFDYNYLGKGLQRKTSSFLAPAYLIIAPGIDWHPKEYFTIFLSPASIKMVLVSRQSKSYYFNQGIIPDSLKGPGTGDYEVPLSVLYGVDPRRKIRTELGGFLSVNFNKEILKNVIYKSRLDLYSNYLKTDRYTVIGPDQLKVTEMNASPEKVDILWSSLFVMKINKLFNVTYNFDLVYDDDVRQFGPNKTSAAMQWRSLLAIGLAAKF